MKLSILRVRETSGETIRSPDMVSNIMAEEAQADRECFWVLHLNTSNRLIEKELVSMGTADSAQVHPREVFKKAVMYGAISIITVHNHPSGQIEPSKEDRRIWSILDEAGTVLGIDVIDHMIITPTGEFYSKAEQTKNRRKPLWTDQAGT